MGPEGCAYLPVRVYRHRCIIAATRTASLPAGDVPLVAATMPTRADCVSDQIIVGNFRSCDQPRLSDELFRLDLTRLDREKESR